MDASGDSIPWIGAQARSALLTAGKSRLGDLCPGRGGVLIVAPHPDEETLGCGGLIALAAVAKHPITVAVLTDRAASHTPSCMYPHERLSALRHQEVRAAVALLSDRSASLECFGAPDGQLERHAVDALPWLNRLPGSSVFAPWIADPHADHQAAFRIAARYVGRRAARLFAYPIRGLTLSDDAPAGARAQGVRLDIQGVIELKRQAIELHRSQTSNLIEDDPRGFRLTVSDIARHTVPHELLFKLSSRDQRGAS